MATSISTVTLSLVVHPFTGRSKTTFCLVTRLDTLSLQGIPMWNPAGQTAWRRARGGGRRKAVHVHHAIRTSPAEILCASLRHVKKRAAPKELEETCRGCNTTFPRCCAHLAIFVVDIRSSVCNERITAFRNGEEWRAAAVCNRKVRANMGRASRFHTSLYPKTCEEKHRC